MHVMIDIETMGTAPGSAIIEIGAVAFELKSGGRVYNGVHAFRSNVLIQEGAGSVDHGTLCFWLQECAKGSDMPMKLMSDAIPLDQALRQLDQWPEAVASQLPGFTWEAVEGVWAKGPQFDIANLTDKYRRLGRDCPWHYSRVRDQRTFMSALGVNPKDLTIDPTGFKPHDGVDDCIWQITEMQHALGLRR